MRAHREAVWAVVVLVLVALLVAVMRPRLAPEAPPSPAPTSQPATATPLPTASASAVPPAVKIPSSGRLTMGGIALGMTRAEVEQQRRAVFAGHAAGETPVGIQYDDDHDRVVWTEGNTIERGGVVVLRAGESYQQMVELFGPPSRVVGPADDVRYYHYTSLQVTIISFKGPWIIDRINLGCGRIEDW